MKFMEHHPNHESNSADLSRQDFVNGLDFNKDELKSFEQSDAYKDWVKDDGNKVKIEALGMHYCGRPITYDGFSKIK